MISLPDFDPVSTREDWADTVELIDADTGAAVDFSGYATWTLEARRLTPNGVSEVKLAGSNAGGEITFPDGLSGGVMQILFRTPFAGEEGGTYRITIVASNGADTILLMSHLPVINLERAPA